MDALSARPIASIPGACGDWADTIGAYRFVSNEAIEWPAVLAPHIQSSVTRMAAHDVVLCIQDATELDFKGQVVSGLGPLSYEAQRGMFFRRGRSMFNPWRQQRVKLLGWTKGKSSAETRASPVGLHQSTAHAMRYPFNNCAFG